MTAISDMRTIASMQMTTGQVGIAKGPLSGPIRSGPLLGLYVFEARVTSAQMAKGMITVRNEELQKMGDNQSKPSANSTRSLARCQKNLSIGLEPASR